MTPANAGKFLEGGAAAVIVTSYVFKDGRIDMERLQEMVEIAGKDRLVLDLSCRQKEENGLYYVVTDKWRKFTEFAITYSFFTLLLALTSLAGKRI